MKCQPNAIGSRCDRCHSGYYAVAQQGTTAVQCIICPCPLRGDGQPSNCKLDVNQEVVCLDCRYGYSGRLCDECAPGFEKISGDCEQVVRRCDSRGSIGLHTGLLLASPPCNCRRYVSGHVCNTCQENTFHLSESNPDGCLPCFCMGVTRSCTSSTLNRTQIRLSAQSGEHGLVITDENRLQNFTDGFRADQRIQGVVYQHPGRQPLPIDSYWLLPSKFLGNMLASYGGYLQYKTPDVAQSPYPDIKIGGTGITLHYRNRRQQEERPSSTKVQFSEQYWTDAGGRRATRNDLLVVLSNLEYIMIKAAHDSIARIGDVVLDTAERRNTGFERAYAVEECVCPVGYKGLSCENCDSGYWKSNPNPIIGQCQPCDCHGHSSTCDPATGQCMNCRHNTEGRYCDVCARGYYGDATHGTPSDCLPCPCPLTHSPNQFSPTCILDTDHRVTCTACPAGHTGRMCEYCADGYSGDPRTEGEYCRRDGGIDDDPDCGCDDSGTIAHTRCDVEKSRCQCKAYVEGQYCSQCQRGYFFLSSDNPQGCVSCFCMGLTRDCRSSNYYRSQIEPDYVANHGFKLTTRRLDQQIEDRITADSSRKIIHYGGSLQAQMEKSSLYWNLPSKFTGNKVNSYGGYLSFQLEYTFHQRLGSGYQDADIELISGDSRFYMFLQSYPLPGEINVYNISLVESSFRQIDGASPTRETFLKAFASLDAILIRATHYSYMPIVTLGRLSMDTAVDWDTHQKVAVEVEQCSCPDGYSGLSCEECVPGYSRVPDPSVPLGRCVRCSCNNHSSSCDLHTGSCLNCRDHTTGDRCDQCEAGFFGDPSVGTSGDCQPCPCPRTSQENRFSSTCSLDADGRPTCDQCPPGYTGRQCESCALGYIRDPNVTNGNCSRSREEDRLRISVSPMRQTVSVGGEVTFRCSVEGSEVAQVQWIRADGRSLPARAVVGADRALTFQKVESTDEGRYICIAANRFGRKSQEEVSLTVSEERRLQVIVNHPKRQTVSPGATVRFNCTGYTQYTYTLAWSRQDGQMLSPRIADDGQGILTIRDVQSEDAGSYVCTGSNYYNIARDMAVLEVTAAAFEIVVSDEELKVVPGSEARLSCSARGNRVNVEEIEWSRERGNLPSGSYQLNGQLVIPRCEPSDSGTYICTIYLVNGERRVAYSTLVVNPDDVARIQLRTDPERQSVQQGSQATIRCLINGAPTSAVKWSRIRDRLGSNHRIDGNILTILRASADDQGTYVCEAENRLGRVTATADLYIESAPLRVSLVPRTQTLRPGDYLRLICNVQNSHTTDIEWSKEQGFVSPHAIVRQNTLEIVSVTASDAGHYRCQATDVRLDQVADALAEVILLVPPSAVVQPRSLRVEVGRSVEFTCDVTGHPQPTVQWNKEIGGLPSGHQLHGFKLFLDNVQPQHAGRYVCIVNNDVGTTRDYATLEVLPNGGNGNSVKDQQKFVTVGDRVVIKCEVAGDPSIRVTWKRMDGPLPPTAEIEDTLLVLPEIEPSDQGTYRCLASNVLETVYAQITIIVQGPPLVTLSRQTRTVAVGTNVTVTCRAGGSPTPTLSWSKREGRLPRGSTVFNNTLYIVNLRSEDFGDFICTATNRFGVAEGVISLLPSGAVPYFAQNPVSYHTYPGIRDAYANIDFEISFKSESLDGLILYNGQSHAANDFVAFGLRDGRAEFRFDVGSGPVFILSEPLTLDVWHTIRARKYGKDSMLVVDGKEYRIQIAGRFIGLDLAQDLYIGGMPDFRLISKEAKYNRGFKGCISRLIINGVRTHIGDDALATVGVSNCPVCQDHPCRNGGLCQSAASRTGYQCSCTSEYTGLHCELTGTHCERDTCGSHGRCYNLPDERGYKCACPVNKSGPRCEQGTSVNIPSFNQTSFAAYATIQDTLKETHIELTFNPKSLDDAILLYNAFDELGDNDFVALLIIDKYVEFRYNLGSGPAIIQSLEILRVGEWTTVVANIYQKNGSLTVNDGPTVTGESSGTTVGLNLKTLLYVGGVDHNSVRLALDVTVDRGFHGCISKLKIKGRDIDLVKSAIENVRVAECVDEVRESVCHRLTPCQNGGSCQDVGSSHRCVCPPGFIGEACNIRVNALTSAEFTASSSSSSYVEIPQRMLVHHSSREEVIRMTVRTTSADGVLLWQSQEDTGAGGSGAGKDFIALSLENGLVVFSYELGSGQALLVSNLPIDDGEQHKIVAKRKGKAGVLTVDDNLKVIGESSGKMTGLDVTGSIYLGGVPDIQTAAGGRFSHQFTGCISDVFFQTRGPVDFARNATQTVNIVPCSLQ